MKTSVLQANETLLFSLIQLVKGVHKPKIAICNIFVALLFGSAVKGLAINCVLIIFSILLPFVVLYDVFSYHV